MILGHRRALIAAAPACQFVLAGPLRVFATNPDFARVAPGTLVASSVLVFLGVFGAIAGLLAVFRQRWVAAMVLALAVVGFLQQTVLLRFANHGAFDGTAINWDTLRGLAVVEVVIALVVTAWLLHPRVRMRYLGLVALFLLVFQLAGLAVQTPSIWRARAQEGATEVDGGHYLSAFAELSPKQNIIHIVADHTQGALTYDLLQERIGHFGAKLDGFTMFLQASGRYPSTYPSISFYMTGRYPEPEADEVESLPLTNEDVRTTLGEHSLVNALAGAGFETYGATPTSLYCAGDYTACLPIDILSGLPESGSRADAVVQYLRLLDVSLFQGTPIVLRRRIFRDGQWFLTGRASGFRTASGVMDEYLRRLKVGDSEGSYNYIHHPGGHPPIQFDGQCEYIGTQDWNRESTAEQITCLLEQISELIERLQRLDVYDQTLIVIHGDHGSQWSSPLVESKTGSIVAPSIIGMANPLMLIKPLGARGTLRFSRAPVSLRDVPATLIDAMGIAADPAGTPMFQVAEDAVRERQFVYYKPGLSNIYREGNLGHSRRYRIRGDLFNQYDWIPPIRSLIEGAPSAVRAVDHDFAKYGQGFVAKATATRPNWRYVEGRLARLYLTRPAVAPTLVELRVQAPETLAEQEMELWLGGKRVAVLSTDDLRAARTHRLPLTYPLDTPPPDTPPLDEVVVLVAELRMQHMGTVPDHGAPVSLRFHSIGLLTGGSLEDS